MKAATIDTHGGVDVIELNDGNILTIVGSDTVITQMVGDLTYWRAPDDGVGERNPTAQRLLRDHLHPSDAVRGTVIVTSSDPNLDITDEQVDTIRSSVVAH